MAETRERDFEFTLTRSRDENGDGQTFEGYIAVFNSTARIEERDGSEFDEVIVPGAFKKSIAERTPFFMFCHGKHPLIGQMPLGTITELREDARGLFIRARLTDNWLIQPVRDAIRDGAVTGCSARMEVTRDVWSGRASVRCRRGELRTIKEVRLVECGPVVAPAYEDTTASVRSAFRDLEKVVEGITVNVSTRDTATVSTQEPTVIDLVKSAIKDRLGLDSSDDVRTVDSYEDDGRLVFTVAGNEASNHSGLWSADFAYADGVVTLSGDPQAVQAVGYEPRSREPRGETRSDLTFCAITCAVEEAVEELIHSDDMTSDVWVCDITDTWAVFQVWGALEGTWPGYWKIEYTIDADMAVTLSDPVAVEQAYVPSTTPPERCVALKGQTRSRTDTSADAAPTGTSADAVTERHSRPHGRQRLGEIYGSVVAE